MSEGVSYEPPLHWGTWAVGAHAHVRASSFGFRLYCLHAWGIYVSSGCILYKLIDGSAIILSHVAQGVLDVAGMIQLDLDVVKGERGK